MRRKRLERGSERGAVAASQIVRKGSQKGSCSRNCFNRLQGSGCIESLRAISAVVMQPVANPSLSAVHTEPTVSLLLQDSRGFLRVS